MLRCTARRAISALGHAEIATDTRWGVNSGPSRLAERRLFDAANRHQRVEREPRAVAGRADEEESWN